MKKCTKCGEIRPLDQFGKDARYADRPISQCKKCRSAYNRKWRLDNIEMRRADNREWRTANRSKVADDQRRRYATDTASKLARVLRARLCSAVKRKSKRGSAVALLGCTIDGLIAQFESQFAVGMSWANYGKWHVDHIRPLSSFDLEDPAQLAVACHHTNLQPLWATENMSKGGRAA